MRRKKLLSNLDEKIEIMIAASEPQEFVPSGRQQALRHPTSRRVHPKNDHRLNADILLDKLEKISLKEVRESEWWIIRKSPIDYSKEASSENTEANQLFESFLQPSVTKSHFNSEFLDESFCLNKSADLSRRISGASFLQQSDALKHSTKFSTRNEAGYMEDELYIQGHVVVWSRGLSSNCDNLDNGRKTICAYTLPLPVSHALWCTFHREYPTYESNLLQVDDEQEKPGRTFVPAVCIIDWHNIRVFTPKGEDFVTALPFEVGDVWSSKYGILIEKKGEIPTMNLCDSKTSLFSLAYPQDDVCPVLLSSHSQLQFFSDNFEVVFVNEEPGISLVYDRQTKQHSVYLIRKISRTEKYEYLNKLNSTCQSAQNISSKKKNRLSVWDFFKNTNHIHFPNPVHNKAGNVGNVYNAPQPKTHGPMAALSRCQSPAASSIESAWLQSSSKISCSVQHGGNVCMQSSNTFSYFNTSKVMSHLHSNPEVCFEHLWTDSFSNKDDNLSSSASKAFLCDDFTGQWYLCYILPLKYKLCMVQTDFSCRNSITFGMFNSISAKDAIPVPSCHMLAILEHNGNVTLYSGLTPVGKLHIGGTLVQHTPSPYVRRNLSQFTSPFPRRSSLLPHSKSADPKFDEHLLSPVLPETSDPSARTGNVLQLNFQLEGNLPKAVLNGLRDPVENRITLRYSDGTYYRISLPPLTSHSLIENCIIALKQCLMKDTTSIILTRWYATRNALGSQNMNLEQEWEMFHYLILELLGYEEQNSENIEDTPVTPSSNPKRQKHSPSGTDEDWFAMLNANYQSKLENYITQKLCLNNCQPKFQMSLTNAKKININSILFPHFRTIHYCLHLLYEDLKLNTLRADDLKLLAKLLSQMSSDLGLIEYTLHYWKDFPDICEVKCSSTLSQNEMKNIITWPCMNDKPANIMKFIHDLIQGRPSDISQYPFIHNVNVRSRDVIQICATIVKEMYENRVFGNPIKILEAGLTINDSFVTTEDDCALSGSKVAEQATLLMVKKKFTVRDLDTLPSGIYLLFYSALWKCRNNPPSDFPVEAYYLLWRNDLAAHTVKGGKGISEIISDKSDTYNSQLQGLISSTKPVDVDQQDGMEEVDNSIMKLRFPDDIRVAEARKMLQSSKPVSIVLVQRPDVSDHDFIEEQEKHLYAICTRTMALSPGRGMLTLRTAMPVITEPLPTPQLCLTGKAPPRGTTVELNHIDTPSNMNLWPLFHNGVASALRITPNAHNIDNTWIVFNKPKNSVEQQMEHAGFLMALGLNGHLRNLDVLNTYDYLVKSHEMISIGLLLGMSASFRGTSNAGMTKTLSIHVEALLPPTSMELDVHQNVQVAALMGVGLVYQGTCHRHIIEVLLSEIARPPGPEMENSVDRESYSLAAGLALGLVTLKHGNQFMSLSDLNVPDTLKHYMVGGNRRPLTGAQKDKYKVSSFQIREGSCVNLDVTSPGSTIALGLMYLGSNNKAIADWMAPPETHYLLDFIRPDFLMFRVLARALILWDDIEPTKEWIERQVPDSIRPYCMIKPQPNTDIDYEAMNQAYCNIVTGACFALGLKYAGSADEDAFRTLLYFCHLFTNLTIKSIAELAGKPTVETCLNVLLLSTSMVMAGTGNLDVMRLVRLLRRRVGVATSAVVTYGSHMATHMALGLLYLGGGKYTLSNSPANIAALICAFYPKFPTHSNDNRYHLQAFRHLYVLAVEPRIIIPKDISSGRNCYATLRIVKLNGSTSTIRGPGIIPALDTLQKVAVEDERYWPIVFERDSNWDLLTKILAADGFVEVKQRAGCLSYIADKLGYHSQLARTLTQSEVAPWDPQSSSIVSFTSDLAIKFFCEHFLSLEENEHYAIEEQNLKQMLTKITYDAVVKDKLVIIPVFTFLTKVLRDAKLALGAINFWQVKLISAQLLTKPLSTNLISTEVMLAIEAQLVEILENWENSLAKPLWSYLTDNELNYEKDILRKLAMYVIFYDIPFKDINFEGHILEILLKLQCKYSTKTIEKVTKLINIR